MTIRTRICSCLTLVAMLLALQSPFDESPQSAGFAGFPPDWASTIEISCSS